MIGAAKHTGTGNTDGTLPFNAGVRLWFENTTRAFGPNNTYTDGSFSGKSTTTATPSSGVIITTSTINTNENLYIPFTRAVVRSLSTGLFITVGAAAVANAYFKGCIGSARAFASPETYPTELFETENVSGCYTMHGGVVYSAAVFLNLTSANTLIVHRHQYTPTGNIKTTTVPVNIPDIGMPLYFGIKFTAAGLLTNGTCKHNIADDINTWRTIYFPALETPTNIHGA